MLLIIVIDDNKDFTDLTCDLLRILGYEVTGAWSGEEGLVIAKEQKPIVIFCNLEMPGMNGYDVARRIRRDKELRDVYLIAISGNVGQAYQDRSKRAGFDKYLGKPINLGVFGEILDNLIGLETEVNGYRKKQEN